MNKGKEILKEFLKEDSAYSLRYSFNGDIVRDKDLFRDYLRELIKENEKMHSIIKEVREYIEKSMSNPQPFYEYLYGDEDGNVKNLDKLLQILDKENSNGI